MAEVIGLIASVTGIAAVGAKLSMRLFDLTSQVGSARHDVATIGLEISAFSAVLGHIATRLEPWSTVQFSKEAVKTAGWIAARAEVIFKELEAVINNLTPAAIVDQEAASASMSITKRVVWLFKRQRVVQLRASLESMKITLQLMLTTVDISIKIQSRRSSVASVETVIEAENGELAVAESLVIAHQLSIERLRTLEDDAESERTGSSESSILSTQPSAVFTTDPAQNSRSTGLTDLKPDEKGKSKDSQRDSAVLMEATSVPGVTGLARRSMDSLASVSSVAPALLAGKWTQSSELTSVVAAPTPRMEHPDPRRTQAGAPAPASKSSEVAQEPPKKSFPHAFERWEALSSHWEGLTSFWIRRLEYNADNLGDDPMTSEVLRGQVRDLSAAGANLFHAVVELQRLRASSERKFQRWFFETRSEIERYENQNAVLEEKMEEQRARFGTEIARERQLADEALQTRAQLQQDLSREALRFNEERQLRARLQEELRRELGRVATEKKSKQDLQAELSQQKVRHKAELSDSVAKVELLQAEVDQEKERRQKVIRLLSGDGGEPQATQPSRNVRVSSASSVSSAGSTLSRDALTPNRI